VLAGDVVILGRVVSASEDTARIRLLTHPGQRTEAVIYGSATTTTTVTGAGGGNYRTRLPAGVDVSVGNAVIDARTGDYVLGNVREVREAESDSFQHILFRTPVNIQ
jgi:cell shape-determining protein MreC